MLNQHQQPTPLSQKPKEETPSAYPSLSIYNCQRTKPNRAEHSTEAGLKVKDQSAAVSRGIDPHLNTVNSLSEKTFPPPQIAPGHSILDTDINI
jgi:hypothetical protein